MTKETLPVTMGHEMSGRVIQAPSASPFSPGQKVVIDPRFYCSTCTACSKAATNCCRSIGFMGLSGGGGGLASTVAVSQSNVHALPEETDLAAAALIEPLAVAWHAVKLSGAHADAQEPASASASDADMGVKSTPILIVGGGPVGVAVAFVLRAREAEKVLVSEPSARRREFFTDMVRSVLDPTTEDVVNRCCELSPDGEGVGIVFDCAGVQSGMEAACQALRFGGRYVNLAMPKGPVSKRLCSFIVASSIDLDLIRDDFKFFAIRGLPIPTSLSSEWRRAGGREKQQGLEKRNVADSLIGSRLRSLLANSC